MRGLAILVLFAGPLVAAPAAAALWMRDGLMGLLAFGVAVLVEAMLLWRRDLMRQVTVLALAVFWSAWLWRALTQPGDGWTAPPAFQNLGRHDWPPIILLVLVYLTFYEIAESKPRGKLS